ncbi:MAG: polymer-forming cytoskeletal protein [Desulfobacterales bacterium]
MKNKSDELSIIDKELTVDGTLSTKGRLVIKGVVKGTLVGENVVIAEEGAVFADTKVNNIKIGGTFEGEVRASNELIVLSTGNCSGKIVCKDFIVEAGGILNARVSCIKAKDPKIKKGLFRFKKK